MSTGRLEGTKRPHSSDSLEELLEESLDELEWPIDRVPVTTFRHFRSDDFLYTFENDVPIGEGDPDEAAAIWMLAYEATFRALGDVAGVDDIGEVGGRRRCHQTERVWSIIWRRAAAVLVLASMRRRS